MPVLNRYRFQAEVISAQGSPVGVLSLQPDWGPALEWCLFQGIREGRHMSLGQTGSATVEPVWHSQSGPPYVDRISIGFTDLDGDPFTQDVPTTFFHADVEREAISLVSSGDLLPGETFTYSLYAFTAPGVDRSSPSEPSAGVRAAREDDLEGEAVEVSIDVETRPLAPLVGSSQRQAADRWNENDLPVFIPQNVVDELCSQASADAQLESGAVLIGRLCRDPQGGNDARSMFLQVTAQIPAQHTIAEYTSLTFTGETWAAIDGVIKLRGRNEMILGWAHSHPFFCRKCPDMDRLNCAFSRPVFSASDVNVHRTVFSHAYQIALLLSFLGEERPSCDLFAWREGRITRRGFYVC